MRAHPGRSGNIGPFSEADIRSAHAFDRQSQLRSLGDALDALSNVRECLGFSDAPPRQGRRRMLEWQASENPKQVQTLACMWLRSAVGCERSIVSTHREWLQRVVTGHWARLLERQVRVKTEIFVGRPLATVRVSLR